MRVGLVGLWFERGNAYLTYGLRQMLLPHFDVHVLARTGYIIGAKGRQSHMEESGRWNIPNITRLSSYDIDPVQCAEWIRANRLSAVIWNEEINLELPKRVRSLLGDYPCQQIAYLDWVGPPAWVDQLSIAFHHLLCATERTRSLVPTAKVFRWGVDLNLFRPGVDPPFLFFHNAGWTGTNFRKGSIAVLNAWTKAFGASGKGPTMLFHTQKPLSEYPLGCRRTLTTDSRITVREGTVTAPGLYHQAKVYLGPSKLEGLGLTLSESLACGMYLVTTNAPPMNEHGDPMCTEYIPVKKTSYRGDRCAFPETDVDVEYLALRMKAISLLPPAEIKHRGICARLYAEKNFDHKINGPRLATLLKALLPREASM